MKPMPLASFDPTLEQQTVIIDKIDKAESALIISGPGTGKTRTAIEAARRVIALLQQTNRRQVLFLSFSNATIQRLAQSAGVQFNQTERRFLRFMTYHSCAADILASYGRFVGLPAKVKIVDKLEERLLAFEMGLDSAATDYQQHLFELARARGALAFDVLIDLAVRLLKSSGKLRRIIGRNYPLIIADEFQDTSGPQWELLKLLGEDSQVLAFADPNQIIYSSIHGATEQRLNEFMQWKGIEKTPFSRTNFRCANSRILVFSDCLLSGSANIPSKGSGVKIFQLRARDQLRVQLVLIWKAIQDQIGKGQTIGFLAPSNKQVEEIAVALRHPPEDAKMKLPIFAQMVRDEAAIDSILLSLAALRDAALTIADGNYAKAAITILAMNLSWNNKARMKHEDIGNLVNKLKSGDRDNASVFGRILSLVRSEGKIESFVEAYADLLTEIKEFQVAGKRVKAYAQTGRLIGDVRRENPQLGLYDDVRLARKPKGLYGDVVWEGKTHIMTYHKAKGREFDFVVMIVDPRQESDKSPLEEKRRLYHVCATRAKRWLGVIYFGQDVGRVLGPVIKPALQ